jgi:hypothetical protein
MRVRFAVIAIVAVLLLSGLSLVLAQPPDCTTRECVYLPIIEHHVVPTLTATFTAVPTSTSTPTSTQVPTPTSPTITPTRDPNQCAAEYPTVCIPPPPPDLDCPDITFRNFLALPPDRHNFDTDNDQVGCEQN